ncbi:ABC transporter permease [Hazenella coriacea]|uniref:ABC-type transport system involved in multi-copper enzyme maturation permease subunit n=1 Tax=Hazenella coriacea TaxID=1179467 RepID=A0A4R3LC16_9BACL|nr:hypothetical protein [Hazenella coriacea]TCS96785.1 ABC-type transport system involved in multi-copper enzyme maturation permease subunit [Hazenella coriacea]
MDKWFGQLRLESKLIFSNYVYLALPFLFAGWMVFVILDVRPEQSQDLYMYVYNYHKIQHILSLSVAILLGIQLIRREWMRASHDWVLSYPISGFKLVSAKWTAAMLYLSLFSLTMLIVYVSFAFRQGLLVEEILDRSLLFLLVYEWDFMYTLTLSMLLAMVIRNRIVYLIGFSGWVFFTFFMDVFIKRMLGLYYLGGFQLSQFSLDSILENEAWGPWMSSFEIWATRLMVLGMCLWFVSIMITLIETRRPSNQGSRWKIISFIMVFVCAVMAFPYSWLWAEKYQGFAAIENYTPVADRDVQWVVFDVNQVRVNVHKQTNDNVKVKAELTIPTSSLPEEKVPFTLNHSLQVKKISVDGKELSFEREGEILSIDRSQFNLGKTEQVLLFEYEGQIMNWYYNNFADVTSSFVKDDYVLLPAYVAWYPIPGNQPLFVKQNGVNENFHIQLLNPADFEVTLQGFPKETYVTLPLVSQQGDLKTYAMKQTSGVSLLAGNMIKVNMPDDPFTIITTSSNRKEAETFLKTVVEAKHYFNSWLNPQESPKLETIIYLPYVSVSERTHNVKYFQGNSLMVYENMHNNLDANLWRIVVNIMLFGDLESNLTEPGWKEDAGAPYKIRHKIRAAFYYLYARDHQKLTDEQILMDERMFFYNELDVKDPFTKQISTAINEGKISEVKQVLNHFYQKGLFIEDNINGEGPKPDPSKIISVKDWMNEWNRVMKK